MKDPFQRLSTLARVGGAEFRVLGRLDHRPFITKVFYRYGPSSYFLFSFGSEEVEISTNQENWGVQKKHLIHWWESPHRSAIWFYALHKVARTDEY